MNVLSGAPFGYRYVRKTPETVLCSIRRTILTSCRPSSSSISRIRSRSLTAPVPADKAPRRKGDVLLRH